MKYTAEIVSKICELIEKDAFTIKEICYEVGITQSTYFEWKGSKPEFSERIKKAFDTQMQNITEYAKKSLVKKINGYEYEEISEIYNGEVLRERKVVKKFIPPSDVAIIFALTNRDSDNWKHKSEVETKIKPVSEIITYTSD